MERLPRLFTVVGMCGLVVVATLASAQEPPLEPPAGRGVPAKALLIAPKAAVRKQRTDVMQTPQDALKRRIEQLNRLKDGEMRDVRVINQQDFARLQVQLQADQIRLQTEQLTQQTMQQIRPFLAGELHFVRTACSPNDEQLHAIAHEGLRALRALAREQAEAQFNRNRGMAQARLLSRDFGENAHIAMADAASKHLNAEQLAAYQSASAERAAFRQQAALHNIVAAIDDKLKLTDPQREAIGKTLAEHWDATWNRSLMAYLYGDRFLPAIPDGILMPVLDDNQRSLWKSMPRQTGTFFGSVISSVSPLEDRILLEECERDDEEAQRASEAAARAEQEKAEAENTKQVPKKSR